MDWKAHRPVWDKYQQADTYNSNLGLYEAYKRNEDFYNGKQWEGLLAPDLEKPVLNIIQHVVRYFIAMIVSDDVAANITPSGEQATDEQADVLNKAIERVMEDAKISALNRVAVRNMAVNGDACMYLYFDPDADTGQMAKGRIAAEVIANTKVLFSNPYEHNIQKQPCVFVVTRRTPEDVKAEAKRNGKDPNSVIPDEGAKYGEDTSTSNLTTVVIAFRRDIESGKIFSCKLTERDFVKDWFETGYKLYPVAFANWERVHNSYHGMSPVTSAIPNQIFINKAWAMAMEQVKMMAFPKIIYNRTLLPGGWSNAIGHAIPVTGNPNEAVASAFRAPDMSAQVLQLVEMTISYTRELMGASDAALGNVKPENTSAIIALQKASAAPLELQRLAFYQFVEDYIRIVLDLIRVHYGLRLVPGTAVQVDPTTGAEMEIESLVPFDFSTVNYDALELKVDVGAASYWSEITTIQTLDNLFEKQIVEAVDYLEALPDKIVPYKNELVAKLEARMEAAQAVNPGMGDMLAGPQNAYLNNLEGVM